MFYAWPFKFLSRIFGLNGNITSESICGVFFRDIQQTFKYRSSRVQPKRVKFFLPFTTTHTRVFIVVCFQYTLLHTVFRGVNAINYEQMNLQIRIRFEFGGHRTFDSAYVRLFDCFSFSINRNHSCYTVRNTIVCTQIPAKSSSNRIVFYQKLFVK